MSIREACRSAAVSGQRTQGEYLEAGSQSCDLTSYVFRDGKVDRDNLEKIKKEVGKERLVLDLSCRRKEDTYYIVTDRWQKFTEVL